MHIDPIYAVLCRAVIHHLVGGLLTKRLVRGGAGHAELLDDQLILPLPQELVSITDSLLLPAMSHYE